MIYNILLFNIKKKGVRRERSYHSHPALLSTSPARISGSYE